MRCRRCDAEKRNEEDEFFLAREDFHAPANFHASVRTISARDEKNRAEPTLVSGRVTARALTGTALLGERAPDFREGLVLFGNRQAARDTAHSASARYVVFVTGLFAPPNP
jgi:hypothetical protein